MRRFAVLWMLLFVPLWASAACFTPSQLTTELNNDSASLNYVSYVNAGNDAGLMDVLNLVRPGAGYVVSKGVVSQDSFLGTWADVIAGFPFIADATIKTRWTWFHQALLIPKATIDLNDPQITGFFTQMITDGLNGTSGPLTNDDVNARTTRQGSRAEVVWGTGCRVTDRDVACATRAEACQ